MIYSTFGIATDLNSNSYQTILLGNQIWMARNLDVNRFNNGDLIPKIEDANDWVQAIKNKQPAYCYYNNLLESGPFYGILYNWYAVHDPRGLAPEGYHIPSDQEWRILVEYLGGQSFAGKKLKAKSSWKEFGDGTNESGFNGRPGGDRDCFGRFYHFGEQGCWWGTKQNPDDIVSFGGRLIYNHDKFHRTTFLDSSSASVRCIRNFND